MSIEQGSPDGGPEAEHNDKADERKVLLGQQAVESSEPAGQQPTSYTEAMLGPRDRDEDEPPLEPFNPNARPQSEPMTHEQATKEGLLPEGFKPGDYQPDSKLPNYNPYNPPQEVIDAKLAQAIGSGLLPEGFKVGDYQPDGKKPFYNPYNEPQASRPTGESISYTEAMLGPRDRDEDEPPSSNNRAS